jgi:hypothetical protein
VASVEVKSVVVALDGRKHLKLMMLPKTKTLMVAGHLQATTFLVVAEGGLLWQLRASTIRAAMFLSREREQQAAAAAAILPILSFTIQVLAVFGGVIGLPLTLTLASASA